MHRDRPDRVRQVRPGEPSSECHSLWDKDPLGTRRRFTSCPSRQSPVRFLFLQLHSRQTVNPVPRTCAPTRPGEARITDLGSERLSLYPDKCRARSPRNRRPLLDSHAGFLSLQPAAPRPSSSSTPAPRPGATKDQAPPACVLAGSGMLPLSTI
jgi:hypothetical protein